MKTSRRQFLSGCTAAVAAMSGARLGSLAFGDTSGQGEILVLVFLRGGMDGLNLFPPIDGEDRRHYEEARPRLGIPVKGDGAALKLDAQFGMHPSAAPLLPLFQSKKLAIVQAVGTTGSRSHFDAQRYLELGTPGLKVSSTGWLTRHLLSSPGLAKTILVPALAVGGTPPTSLLGSTETLNMANPGDLNLQIGNWTWVHGDQRAALRRIYELGDSFVHRAGIQGLNAAGLIEAYVRSDYVPAKGIKYPETGLGYQFRILAQMLKLDLGLRVATIDYGGWDTHESQGWQFTNLVTDLAQSLAAFYGDLDDSGSNPIAKRLTVVVQSEFGRRIRENGNLGTDHGTANPMLVLGGNVRGGFQGVWPGLHPDQRFDGADLAPTTDYRQVLSEILIRRVGNPNLGYVFPAYAGYRPANIITGSDKEPDYSIPLPGAISDFAITDLGLGEVVLTWKPLLHATNFRIERREDAAGAWQPIATLSADQLRYVDLGRALKAGVQYRVQAYSGYGEGPYVYSTTTAVGTPLQQWRLRHFGTSEASGIAADDRVNTEDGLPNLTKYALGLDPLLPAREFTQGFVPGRPRPEVRNGVLSLVYVRPTGRDDVRYEVQASADLGAWVPVADVLDGTEGNWERRRATATGNFGSRGFMRLVVKPM